MIRLNVFVRVNETNREKAIEAAVAGRKSIQNATHFVLLILHWKLNRRAGSASGNLFLYTDDQVFKVCVRFHFLVDLLAGVDDGGVVTAAKFFADLWKRKVG